VLSVLVTGVSWLGDSRDRQRLPPLQLSLNIGSRVFEEIGTTGIGAIDAFTGSCLFILRDGEEQDADDTT